MCSFFETLSLLLDFLITSSYYRYVLNRATRLVLVSLRKIVRRHGISKSVSNPFRLPLFLFFSLNFFRFFFLAETDDQSSLITESFDMVVHEVLLGKKLSERVINTVRVVYCRIDAFIVVCLPSLSSGCTAFRLRDVISMRLQSDELGQPQCRSFRAISIF